MAEGAFVVAMLACGVCGFVQLKRLVSARHPPQRTARGARIDDVVVLGDEVLLLLRCECDGQYCWLQAHLPASEVAIVESWWTSHEIVDLSDLSDFTRAPT